MPARARRGDDSDGAAPELPATSWAVLGLLSHADELSGYDLKKWANWSLQFFYWSPSYSQIYAELKRLERLGYAQSRAVVDENSLRGKRMYSITPSGLKALSRWVNDAPVDPPVLKHGVMLRAYLGQLAEPGRLREILEQHLEHLDRMRRWAAADAEGSEGWPYPEAVLRWCTRYYESEHALIEELLADVETLEPGRSRRPPARLQPSPGRTARKATKPAVRSTRSRDSRP